MVGTIRQCRSERLLRFLRGRVRRRRRHRRQRLHENIQHHPFSVRS